MTTAVSSPSAGTPSKENVDSTSPALEVRAVSKSFPGVRALSGVDLVLNAGEVHALVGENGAGKSTLIKVITGVYTPDEGEILVGGHPVSFTGPGQAQQSGVSTIFQEVNLVPQLSVARNLFLGREQRRWGLLDLNAMNAQAAETLQEYGVIVDPRRPLRELGLGIQQMVAVARALSTDARVVIMDEPTSSLEPAEVEQLFDVVEVLQKRGVAVLYVSHKLGEIFRLCQSVTVLRDGRRVHSGPVAELDRLSLVGHMLGRPPGDVKAEGVTSFTATGPSPDYGDTVLEAIGITRRNLLHNVSLRVRAGEIIGLAGLLGSGRTESVRAIYGAQQIDSGRVTVSGRALGKPTPAASIRAGLSMLSEDRKSDGIIPELSIRENITLSSLGEVSRWGFISRRREKRLAATYMERLGVRATSQEQQIGLLSGGNQQKALLARMMLMKPKVLILDEPTRGIDVGAKAEIQGLIDELAVEQRVGVVLISSELDELVEGAHTVVVLREGAVAGILEGDAVTEEQVVELIASASEAASNTSEHDQSEATS